MARLPSLFVSHGAPTFALEPGQAGQALTALARKTVETLAAAGWPARADERRWPRTAC